MKIDNSVKELLICIALILGIIAVIWCNKPESKIIRCPECGTVIKW